jgi:hypothetical protein
MGRFVLRLKRPASAQPDFRFRPAGSFAFGEITEDFQRLARILPLTLRHLTVIDLLRASLVPIPAV